MASRPRAAERLSTAHHEALTLSARPLVAEIEGLARRARVPLEAAPELVPAAALEATGLSPRELEVVALVGEGHTNREIGTALFISEKTVSVHVSRILAKLGARQPGGGGGDRAAARAPRPLGLSSAAREYDGRFGRSPDVAVVPLHLRSLGCPPPSSSGC